MIGGAVLATTLPVEAMTRLEHMGKELSDAGALLRGVCDLHLHCSPDTKERTVDELTMAREAAKAGYRALMFKSNDFSCHDRAWLVGRMVPEVMCYGSLILNRVHGGINPYAVEKAVRTHGAACKCIYLPTLDAVYPMKLAGRTGGIAVLDERGRVLPEVIHIMEICRDADIMLATGHSAPDESLVLAKKAKETGVGKFVITHANSRIWQLTHEQIHRAIDLGAWIEYSCLPLYWGAGTSLPDYVPQPLQDFISYLQLCPERSFVATDLGAAQLPSPVEGMRKTMEMLLERGLSSSVIDTLFRQNPAHLIGITD